MAGKPSRTLLQLHALQERYAALEATNSELGQTIVSQGALLENLRGECGNLEADKASLEAEVADQVTRLNALRKDRAAEAEKARDSEKRREAAEADNNFLRDQMMGLTRSLAATEGEIRVLREFAPISEQQRYRDGMPRQQVTLRGGDAMSAGADPWHHRRG